MNRRIFLIILAALVLLVIILLAWWWFLSSPQTKQVESGSFGTSGTASSTAQTTSNQPTNTPSQVTAAGQGTNVVLNAGTGASASAGQSVLTAIGNGSITTGTNGNASAPSGVNWLPGGGPTTSFVPSAINQLNGGTTGGQVTIFGSPPAVSTPNDLAAALAVAGIGTALCTAGLFTTGTAAATPAASVSAGLLLTANGIGAASVPTSDKGLYSLLSGQFTVTNANLQSANIKTTFLDCVARTILKAIVNQITAGVVNWINGGFNGQPAFVQNFQQFVGNVADQAAGAYIQGSALSFLCSPFSLQIKIAIAQSYANRNAQACTLSKVISNVQNFMNGDFSQGGWAGMLSFTTTPTNNPFGAYAFAQIGLVTAQNQALTTANKNVTNGGFINFQQIVCPGNVVVSNTVGGGLFPNQAQSAAQMATPGCQTKTVTPGSYIQQTLDNTANQSQNILAEAGVSGSFDAIFSALITQLVTKSLYGGLANLSGTAGYASDFLTPDQQQAQTEGNDLLTTLGNLVTVAQDYGQTEQGSISDIQNVQQQIENLSNCWETASTTAGLPASEVATAAANAAQAQAEIATLQQQVDTYNNNITNANNAIALLQELQSQTLSVGSTADVTAVQNNLNSAASAGQLISQDEADNATQDRTTLQSQLAQQSSATATALSQCQAMLGVSSSTP